MSRRPTVSDAGFFTGLHDPAATVPDDACQSAVAPSSPTAKRRVAGRYDPTRRYAAPAMSQAARCMGGCFHWPSIAASFGQ